MLIEIILLFILGLTTGKVFEKLKLPKLLGYLLLGVILQYIPFFNGELINYKKEITTFALSVILLKAGLGIDKPTLQRVGKRAILLGIIPNILEGSILTVLGYAIFNLTFIEAGMLGFIVCAISPAVVIPTMVRIKEEGYNKNGVPVLNLASSSIDDIVSVVIFSIFLSLYIGGLQSENISTIIKPFIYILLMMIGYLVNKHYPKPNIKNSINKIWSIAQIYLFIVIGLLVNVSVAYTIGIMAVVVIIIGLSFRILGVHLCLINSIFSKKEKLFCMISNTPKATVQASLGAIPLIYGVNSGEFILAFSALSIILTAPIGLILIEKLYKKLLIKI
ncbi:cation:proton antiporter [Mycoplasmatota bacterium WC44]